MTAIFGGSSSSQVDGQSRTGNLVEFKAGRMIFDGKAVRPDLRKGLFYMSVRDSTLHVQWKERGSMSEPEVDLIVIQNEIEFVKVDPSKAKRVFMLKLKATIENNRLFFWMQELSSTNDDFLWKKVESLVKDPSSVLLYESNERPQSRSGVMGSANLMDLALAMDRNELYEILQRIPTGGEVSIGPITVRNVDGNQRLITRAGRPGSSGQQRPRRAATGTPASRVGLDQLRSSIEGYRRAQSASITSSQVAPSTETARIKYHEILSADHLRPLLNRPSSLSRLIEHLPEGIEHTLNGVEQALRSPQVMQRLSPLSSSGLGLITSGSFSVEQFDLPTDQSIADACTRGDLKAFAIALESKIEAKEATGEEVRLDITTEVEGDSVDSEDDDDDDRVVIDDEEDDDDDDDGSSGDDDDALDMS
ncbi:hypothetical protein ACOME3_000734 [Neoechinorhynchus agilis]